MREVVLDTETTGFDPASGHRVIEIGCVELEDYLPTGRSFQRYLHPDRDMPAEAERVHGISLAFLADKPRFHEVVGEFLEFIGDAPLVIHNADFDLRFLNAELERVGRSPLARARAIDTIEIAKAKIPGARYSLDELCKRFSIDLSARGKHGALLDAELTARVYLELVGGRQKKLSLAPVARSQEVEEGSSAARVRPAPLAPLITEEELQAHARFVAKEIGDGAIWNSR